MKTKGSSEDIKRIESVLKNIVKNMATKDDLKHFATKDDLRSLEKNINNKLENFATKEDLKLGLDDLLADIVEVVDKNKAEKSVVEALAKRVDKIEQKLPIVHQ